MNTFLIYLIIGIVTGALYSIAAAGLVLTYATSRIFNVAHGAIGMVMAYLMYTLWVQHGLPKWVALAIVVLVVAPAIGVLLDWAVMRWLERASVAQRLVVTLTLLVLCLGLASFIWGRGQNVSQVMPSIFSASTFSPISGLNVSYDQLADVIVAAVVAFGLWLLLKRTRIGTMMRGVVDDRDLTQLHGLNPRLVTSLSWAIGIALAALAAILLAPGVSMDINTLSLLVVSAYGAAIVGGLTSLPWAFVGAMILGIGQSFMVGYLPPTSLFQNVTDAAPFILLFVVLLLRRPSYGEQERIQSFREPQPPRIWTMLGMTVAGVVLVILVVPHMSAVYQLVVGNGIIYAGILLSLILVTGMAGQVSLAQFSFLGFGDVLLSHLSTGAHLPYWAALIVATVSTALLGAIVGLPALRLRGLYLALSTLAFALLMDNVFFANSSVFPQQGSGIPVPPPSIFGLTARSYTSVSAVCAALVGLCAMLVQVIRKRPFGRALTALRDAPSAASALGLNVVRTRLIVLAVASGMAGLMGCLYGSLYQQALSSQFVYLNSLIALLILSIYGVTSVTGAFIGAAFYSLFYLMIPQWITDQNVVSAIQPLGIGLAVFALAQHPEGAIAQNRAAIARWRAKRAAQAVVVPAAGVPAAAGAGPAAGTATQAGAVVGGSDGKAGA
jgi:branched-chain amino acid transport system permease protein